jgi:hypothetical protein
MRRPNSHKRTRQSRRETAAELEAERATRTPKQQLTRLDERLGKDAGARKERARLQILMKG